MVDSWFSDEFHDSFIKCKTKDKVIKVSFTVSLFSWRETSGSEHSPKDGGLMVA